MSIDITSTRGCDTSTLLGHLATKFQAHPENLATEALAYILNRSVNASKGLHSLLIRCGANLPLPFMYATQATDEDGAIPDLVASDAHGQVVCIVEAKFWAGLTDHQPVTYIHRLPPDRAATLLFVVPSLRLTFLWGEILARCRLAGIPIGEEVDPSPEVKTCRVQGRHTLICASWREVLAAVSSSMFSDDPVIGDITQLKGFTARMDAEAFIPLRSEELTSNMPDRVIQFCQLVDDIAGAVVSAGLATNVGKRSSSTAGAYYQPIAIKGHAAYVQMNCKLWAKYRPTPIWLSIQETISREAPRAASPLLGYLAVLIGGPRPKAFNDGGTILIPIEVLTGAERHAVIESAVKQIREVANLLEPLV